MKRRKEIDQFNELLRRARENKGLTQRELADQLSISPGQIAKYELGQRMPDKRIIDQLRKALELPSDYFFTKRSKTEMETRYEAFLKDYEEVRKYNLDEEQMISLHWVIKRVLLEVSIDSVRSDKKESA